MTWTTSRCRHLLSGLLFASIFPTTTVFALAAPPNVQLVPVVGGMWVFNTDDGSAAYCLNEKTASGIPIGKCAVIGNVGKSPAGFMLSPIGIDLFVVSKTTGAISQCTVVLVFGINPEGSCAQISSTTVLQ
jgi:hypothetical protein